MALVTQEVHVFAGTVADNLRLARPDATDAELRAALDQVGVDLDLDAVVGDGGDELTATQAQQLALARLVLADPDVAILDEATAEAGSAGARVLEAAAERALRGRTALVIAHRLTQAASRRPGGGDGQGPGRRGRPPRDLVPPTAATPACGRPGPARADR